MGKNGGEGGEHSEDETNALLLVGEVNFPPETDDAMKDPAPLSPTPSALMCPASVAGISPFLAWIAFKFGYFSIPYFLLHLLTGLLAVRLQDSSGYVRWAAAFVVTILLSGTKTALFLAKLTGEPLLDRGLLYASTALWECSNAALIVGGQPLLGRFGIDSYRHSFMAVCCPAQIKFVEQPTGMRHWAGRSAHMAAYISAGMILRYLLRSYVDFIETIPILEAEALVVLTSCFVVAWNVPSHLWQLVMVGFPVKVIYPYGSVYFSSSARGFWCRWSRPASQLLRHMIYYPLGGKRRAWMSIPLLFLLNASAHYDVSNSLVGDRSERGWNIVFGLLGLSATLEVLGDTYFSKECRSYRIVRWMMALVAFRVAAFTLVHQCLHLSLASML